MAACNSKPTTTTADSDPNIDSLIIEIDSVGIQTSLKVDYPIQDTMLQRCLAQCVADMIFYTEDEEAVIVKPNYGGDFKAFLQACMEQRWKELWTDIYDYEADPDGDIPTPQEKAEDAKENDIVFSNYEQTFVKIGEDDHTITWKADYNLFHDNSAYPSMYTAKVTLNKANGEATVEFVTEEEEEE